VAARRRVTIRDVAQAAGVSTTTVSDALSGNGRLPDATRARVASVAGRLGYAASPAARSLRGKRAGAIGLYLPEEAGNYAYYLELASGAASSALIHGLALTLIPRSDDPARVTGFAMDGVVVIDPADGDPVVRALSGLGIPVVTCERDLTPGAAHAGVIEGDYRPAVTALLNHLADQGASRVALIAPGPQTAWGLDMRTAYRQWRERSADGSRPDLTYDVPFPPSPELLRAVTLRAVQAVPAPHAVVSGIDGAALGALLAAVDLGLRVPQDMLIASLIDSLALRASTPAITALDLRPADMGRSLATMLHALIEGSASPGAVEVLEPRLVLRESTAARLSHPGFSSTVQ
jgi:DNA-binding LacI/PurR family transcriptional regulator